MSNQNLKNQISEFLKAIPLCVVSSVKTSQTPSSATVAFSQDAQLNLIFGTSISSQKAQNIKLNTHVSVVVTNEISHQTVQLEGQAKVLAGKELEEYQKIHFAKHPWSAKYKDQPDQCWILIKPNWLRLTDISKNPWQVEELNL